MLVCFVGILDLAHDGGGVDAAAAVVIGDRSLNGLLGQNGAVNLDGRKTLPAQEITLSPCRSAGSRGVGRPPICSGHTPMIVLLSASLMSASHLQPSPL